MKVPHITKPRIVVFAFLTALVIAVFRMITKMYTAVETNTCLATVNGGQATHSIQQTISEVARDWGWMFVPLTVAFVAFICFPPKQKPKKKASSSEKAPRQ